MAIKISKKQLCIIWGLQMPCGVMNYPALRRYYFTDDVLSIIGLKYEMYKKMRVFPANVSERIIHEFALTPRQLLSVGIHVE